MEIDNIHFNLSKTDGAQKAFRAVMSCRGSGKSTCFWIKAYKWFKEKGRTTIVFRRRAADITKQYLDDQAGVINKFLPEGESVTFNFRAKDADRGAVDVKIGNEIFFRVLALSVDISRNKSLFLKSTKFLLFDEFICDLEHGEKYISGEDFRFQEIYSTFQRESPDLVSYFFGNVYSLYNPFFAWWGVDYEKLKPGVFIMGDIFSIEYFKPSEELVEYLKKTNPLYARDNEYTKYALYGLPVSDRNIRIVKQCPPNFFLRFVFKIDGRLLAIYKSRDGDGDIEYWVSRVESVGSGRKITVFNYFDLSEGAVLYDKTDKVEFSLLKWAARNRGVGFQDVESNYLMMALYDKF